MKCKIYVGLTPETTARQTLLPAHESLHSSMFSSDVVAFEVAHAVGKRACMESAVCLECIDWDWNHVVVINRTSEDLISLVLVEIMG